MPVAVTNKTAPEKAPRMLHACIIATRVEG
jgi:hypothetical protein